MCNVYVYLNIGTNSAPVFTDSTPILFNGRPLTYWRTIPVFIDIDVDGKKDMVLGGWSSDVRLYSNSGTNSNPIFTNFVYLVPTDTAYINGNPPRVNFTDWDGDGDQDMLTCDYYGSVFLRRNITATDVAEQNTPASTTVRLSVTPNPARDRITIQLSGPIAADAKVEIHDAIGRAVRSFDLSSLLIAHRSSLLTWDGRDNQGMVLPSGVYIVMLTAGTQIQTERLVLVR